MSFRNSLINKFTSSFNLIILNTANLSNSFHGKMFLKDTIFSVLKSGVQLLLIGLRNALMDTYFLTPQYIEWATHQILCALDVKNFLTLSVILSLASTSSEILLLKWAQKKPFRKPETPS